MMRASEINVHLDSSPAGMTEGDMEQENERVTLRVTTRSENRVPIITLELQKQISKEEGRETNVQPTGRDSAHGQKGTPQLGA